MKSGRKLSYPAKTCESSEGNFLLLKTIKMGGNPYENPGIQLDFCWILLDFYRERNFFHDKEVVVDLIFTGFHS